MKITIDDINYAYSRTYQHQRGSTIEECLTDSNSQKADTIFCILADISLNNSPFGVLLLHSDCGVKDFLITYDIGKNMPVIAYRYQYPNSCEWPFNSIDGFVKWLNGVEKVILATAVIATNNVY